ncbi:Protein glass [Cytospora mali]|uniref:Protein glass n=1 Tax=Cytospora mali TaxID=578113 RepID=A0A194V1V8_CYTMA|nr:Protein glass [Valsa mali var. pyri (nom. inval.)]
MCDDPRKEGEGSGNDTPQPCKFCGATFLDIDAMRHHKRKKLQEEYELGPESYLHLWCKVCDLDFSNVASVNHHLRQYHAVKQNLSCPGCNKHFMKLSDFVKHIELDECPTVTRKKVEGRMHQRMSMTKGLGEIDKMNKEQVSTRHEKSFYPYLGHDPAPIEPWDPSACNPSPWKAQDGWGEPDPVASNKEKSTRTARDEYLHGNAKVPDLLTGEKKNQHEGNNDKDAWAKESNSFPNAPVSRKPTAEQLSRLEDNQRTAAERSRGTNLDPTDPNSPMFNAERFWVPYTKKYKCPRQPCIKNALVQHLRSAAHNGRNVSCPTCLKHFDFLYALAAHVESQSQKCHMRQSAAYGWFLNQLTWGAAELGGSNGDYMEKYQFQKEFLEDYGPQKTMRPTYGHEQVCGSQDIDGSATSGNYQQLTAGALAQQQQEIMRSDLQFTPYGDQPQQRGSGGRRGDGDVSVPLTAEALSRLNLQEQQRGAASWFQPSPQKGQEQE